jgi:hypothetical protein
MLQSKKKEGKRQKEKQSWGVGYPICNLVKKE